MSRAEGWRLHDHDEWCLWHNRRQVALVHRLASDPPRCWRVEAPVGREVAQEATIDDAWARAERAAGVSR